MHKHLLKTLVKKQRLINLLKIFILFFLIDSCSYPEISRDELIYDNDFESGNLTEIDGKATSTFNNTTVLGDFNNDGFTLHLENTGDHDYVFISFDLYVHGTWDGNFNGFPENDKPDKWIMELDPDMDLIKDTSSDRFVTTFSNSPCFSNYCLRQSYPEMYPFANNPKKGSDNSFRAVYFDGTGYPYVNTIRIDYWHEDRPIYFYNDWTNEITRGTCQ